MTTKFDKSFAKLHKNAGLTWLPWVGAQYEQNRILVLGESNYADKESGKTEQEAKLAVDRNPDFTRQVVYDLGLRQIKLGVTRLHRANMTFGRIVRLLSPHGDGTGSTTDDHRQVWHGIAYMDVVQNAVSWVQKERHERPLPADFCKGWNVVTKVLGVLNPKKVIVLGVALSNTFPEVSSERLQASLINGVRLPVPFKFKCANDHVAEFIPIAHPASFRKKGAMAHWKEYVQAHLR